MRTRIKICGVTTPGDAEMIARAGVDAIGAVFATSRRRVDMARAREIAAAVPAFVSLVGVFVDWPAFQVEKYAEEVPLDLVQLHGDEPPEDLAELRRKVIKKLKIGAETTRDDLLRGAAEYRDAAAILLDPGAGDGKTFDWSIAHDLPVRLIVSGGLTPANVGDAIRLLRPMAVDVSSGVEASPGVKDEAKVYEFVRAVRDADASRSS